MYSASFQINELEDYVIINDNKLLIIYSQFIKIVREMFDINNFCTYKI